MTPRSIFRRLLSLCAVVLAAAAAAEQDRFPAGSTFSADDGQGNTIATTFDSAGGMWVYVNGDGFGSFSYTVKGDELELKEASMPPDYSCGAAVGKYKWKFENERLVYTLVEDPCQYRVSYFTGLRWMRVSSEHSP
ncbi:MAG TPA: hypothetical protein VF178_17100 [Gemmatimonadaceae bacterium]